MTPVDASLQAPEVALKHVETYLASLPNGLHSHPEYLVKAAGARGTLRFIPGASVIGHVPKEVELLITRPPSATEWIPEAHLCTLFLALLEANFSGNQDEFVNRMYIANKELLLGPIYRVLMLVASPAYLAKNAEARWNTFHRGITMSTLAVPDGKTGTVRYALKYPPNLLPEVLARSYSTAFKAALEAAGGREVTSDVERWTPETCQFAVSWR